MTASSNISRRRRLALSDGGAEYTAKRAELIALAAKLFRENGYQATRLADIADAAGIDRASLYYYVGSKEELFRESVEGILDANLAAAQAVAAKSSEPVASRLRQVVEVILVSYEDNYPHMYVYIQEQMHQVVKEQSAWAKTIVSKTRKLESIVRVFPRDWPSMRCSG
jgi:AcrR family transcriptional regulator